TMPSTYREYVSTVLRHMSQDASSAGVVQSLFEIDPLETARSLDSALNELDVISSKLENARWTEHSREWWPSVLGLLWQLVSRVFTPR
ncbi:MAG TPA: hypothetical protein VGW38_02360, partial [Chloroflexota bacterium]|nr:hypothetical protein [Chloroflexota bacterium]